jgi:prepilin-type N-terminal cleavage/methylation domain-containing protein
MNILRQVTKVEDRESLPLGQDYPATRNPSPATREGFTIIEIALCLAIIGFALVAIIAVLPRGLNVQKRNREETIVSQDAEVWMSAIRSGARGYDDLTNYVICITNFWTEIKPDGTPGLSGNDWYTPSGSGVTSITVPSTPNFPLTNGAHIIGLLSMPKRIPDYVDPPYQSNYVVAYVRAFSGAAVEKIPQTNTTILNDSFIYRMIVENFPYTPVDTNAFCMNCPALFSATNGLSASQVTAALVDRTNRAHVTWMLQTNAHDFRLRFRWPVLLPSGEIPSYGQLTFRGNGQRLSLPDLRRQSADVFRAVLDLLDERHSKERKRAVKTSIDHITVKQTPRPSLSGGSSAFRIPRSTFARAFTLIEIMVVVVLMSVIVLGLMAMFNQTQRAFRAGMTQVDILEAGRMFMDQSGREMQQMAPSYQTNGVNFYAQIPLYGPLVQTMPASTIPRTNILEDLFFISRYNQTWNGIGYFIRTNPSVGGGMGLVGTLYRFETNIPKAQFQGDARQAYLTYLASSNVSRFWKA